MKPLMKVLFISFGLGLVACGGSGGSSSNSTPKDSLNNNAKILSAQPEQYASIHLKGKVTPNKYTETIESEKISTSTDGTFVSCAQSKKKGLEITFMNSKEIDKTKMPIPSPTNLITLKIQDWPLLGVGETLESKHFSEKDNSLAATPIDNSLIFFKSEKLDKVTENKDGSVLASWGASTCNFDISADEKGVINGNYSCRRLFFVGNTSDNEATADGDFTCQLSTRDLENL